MKTEMNIVNRIVRLKESLGISKALYILCACCVLSALLILTFVYRPLMGRLHDASNKLQEVETELLNQQSTIAASNALGIKGKIVQQNEIPLAIDALTEKGKELGLQFRAISPSELQQTTQASIWKLPVSFAIESEYKNMGQFLDYIEGASPVIAETESLSLRSERGNQSKLSTELTLNLYVEKRYETK